MSNPVINNIEKNSRFQYIDIAKGILIVLVVINHLPQVAKLQFDNNSLNILSKANFLWAFYFMPAFFIITGYCSSFDKSFLNFFIKNFKQIMIPAIIINILLKWFENLISFDPNISHYTHVGIREFLVKGSHWWFLPSLFLAKCVFFLQNKYIKNKYIILVSSIFLLFFGLFSYKTNVINIWWFQQSFVLNIFIIIGHFIRIYNYRFNKNIIYLCAIISFTYCFFRKFNSESGFEYIAQTINIQYHTIPLFLFIAISGSIFIILISKKIDKCAILEIMGKYSLFIYILHVRIIKYFFSIFLEYTHSPFGYICLTISAVIVTLYISCSIYYLFNKYAPWVLGKF